MFSIWDKQCGCYLHSGRNSATREEAINAGIEYLTVDWDDEDIKKAEANKEATLEMVELVIEEHQEPIEEAYV